MIRSRHRVTIWLAILGYALVASGLPLPLGGVPVAADRAAAKRLAGKDRSRPFPCMDKPCGCATAEQCFTNCCCNTPSQTLAWAKARGLEPGLIAALERRASRADSEAVVAACCTVRSAPSCCREETPPAETSATAAVPTRAVVLRAMLACGGLVTQWCAAGAAPPPARVDLPLGPCRIDTLQIGNLVPECRADDLDVPPPRAA